MSAPDPCNEHTLSPEAAIRSATYYRKLIRSTKIIVTIAISRKRLRARHLRELCKALRPCEASEKEVRFRN